MQIYGKDWNKRKDQLSRSCSIPLNPRLKIKSSLNPTEVLLSPYLSKKTLIHLPLPSSLLLYIVFRLTPSLQLFLTLLLITRPSLTFIIPSFDTHSMFPLGIVSAGVGSLHSDIMQTFISRQYAFSLVLPLLGCYINIYYST